MHALYAFLVNTEESPQKTVLKDAKHEVESTIHDIGDENNWFTLLGGMTGTGRTRTYADSEQSTEEVFPNSHETIEDVLDWVWKTSLNEAFIQNRVALMQSMEDVSHTNVKGPEDIDVDTLVANPQTRAKEAQKLFFEVQRTDAAALQSIRERLNDSDLRYVSNSLVRATQAGNVFVDSPIPPFADPYGYCNFYNYRCFWATPLGKLRDTPISRAGDDVGVVVADIHT